mgnify:CR=1 FL=1
MAAAAATVLHAPPGYAVCGPHCLPLGFWAHPLPPHCCVSFPSVLCWRARAPVLKHLQLEDGRLFCWRVAQDAVVLTVRLGGSGSDGVACPPGYAVCGPHCLPLGFWAHPLPPHCCVSFPSVLCWRARAPTRATPLAPPLPLPLPLPGLLRPERRSGCIGGCHLGGAPGHRVVGAAARAGRSPPARRTLGGHLWEVRRRAVVQSPAAGSAAVGGHGHGRRVAQSCKPPAETSCRCVALRPGPLHLASLCARPFRPPWPAGASPRASGST